MAESTARSIFQTIPLEQIQASPHQARQDFNSDTLSGLAESMKQEGLIQPVVVRQIDVQESGDFVAKRISDFVGSRSTDGVTHRAATPGPMYELISGERRYRAARLLGWKTIEAKVISTVSDGEAAAKGLIENLQREDLNPVDEARGFAELMRVDPKYWNQERIGQVTGRSQTYISQSLKLLALPEPILQSIRARIFSRSHGLELARLPSPDMQLELAKRIPGHMTWEETRRAVTDILSGKNRSKPKPPAFGPSHDPLKEIWPALLSNPEVALPGSWGVNYSSGRWSFWVVPSGRDSKTDLAYWFRRMAEHLGAPLGGHLSGERPAPAAQARVVPAAPDLDRMAEELKNVRLPKNAQELAEVENLAQKGPGPVYAWLYGAESIMAANMAGATWADLGVTDPAEGCRSIVRALRDAAS